MARGRSQARDRTPATAVTTLHPHSSSRSPGNSNDFIIYWPLMTLLFIGHNQTDISNTSQDACTLESIEIDEVRWQIWASRTWTTAGGSENK